MSEQVTIAMNGTTEPYNGGGFFEALSDSVGDAFESVTDLFGAVGEGAADAVTGAGDLVLSGVEGVTSGAADVLDSIPDVTVQPEVNLPFSQFRAEPLAIAFGVVGIGGIIAYMATKR